MRALALLPLVLLLLSPPADAETRRFALLVGNNAGTGELPPLRFAEADAGKVARVLVEVGNVEEDDVFLLQGRSLAEIERAIALAGDRIAEVQRRPDARALLLFYFSGHSDGEALELGPEKLAFGRLKSLLASAGAEVRLTIIDACKSGAAIAAKGGKPAPGFTIRLVDELATRGEAILASSAADEVALESREVKGSYFTHHLVSGLRGAADASGDGQVTLAEAYRHAYERTRAATAATLAGAQHPVYDFRLSGQGELVLASLSRQSARLELPGGFERGLVFDLARDQVVAELPAGSAPRIALAPGAYGVTAFREGQAFGGRFQISEGALRSVDWSELSPVNPPKVARKGPSARTEAAVEEAADERPALGALLGAGAGVAERLGLMGALRLELELARPSGLLIAVAGAHGRAPGFSETALAARVGWALRLELGAFTLFLGLEAGPAYVGQAVDRGWTNSTLGLQIGPRAGARARLSERLELAVEGELMVGLIGVNSALSARPLPAGFAGLRMRL